MAVTAAPRLVGRARERTAIDSALTDLRAGDRGAIVLEGEPRIGKTALVAYTAARAHEAGAAVLQARAVETEADLPWALLAEALEGDDANAAELPPLSALAAELAASDRHGVHRALRERLEQLGTSRRGLVLCLDDVQWADPASAEALAALVRRPPAAPVLLMLAAREGALPVSLAGALAAALGEERAVVLALEPLSREEAVELVGPAGSALYARAGGNPFYLEQLARAGGPVGDGASGGAVPTAVAAALTGELAALDVSARQLLDGAAIAGDPFELALAAAVAELDEPRALHALDGLLLCGLVRATPTPRRFAFRHPLVREAVDAALPGGWRLGAHARAAAALAARGAGPLERAHHVEHAAVYGDADAVEVLLAAAQRLKPPAPASAARFFAAALRLAPDTPDRSARTSLQLQLADAQAAAGDPHAARRTLLGALSAADARDRLAVTVALANQDWWTATPEDARRRLQVVLADLPAEPSPDRMRARLALALTALHGRDLRGVIDHAADAHQDARHVRDPAFEVAALAIGALAHVAAADGPAGEDRLAESADALERLTAEQLITRLLALWMHGRARRLLGDFDAALADLARADRLATDSGRERIRLFTTIESALALIGAARVTEAVARGEEGLERAELLAAPRMQLWAHSACSAAHLAAGDVTAALRHAETAAGIPASGDFHAADQPGWCLGAALTAAGNPNRAAATLLDALGGPALPGALPAELPAAAADLADAHLARGDLTSAGDAAALAARYAERASTPYTTAIASLTSSAVLLACDQPAQAAAAARAAQQTAPTAAALLRARAQLAEGRALAAASTRRAAIDALIAAEARLDEAGARRDRDAAVRELRRLGHRIVRPGAQTLNDPLAGLTPREHEISRLVSAGRTNHEIATQLVLSTRTIEAHLRNIYTKLNVRSRVELTGALHAIGRPTAAPRRADDQTP